jgi:serine/threonine protein kinase
MVGDSTYLDDLTVPCQRSPKAATASVDKLVGAVLGGRYRLDSFLGSGGQGEVYRGTQLALNRTVAIKVLSPSRAQDPASRVRFEREAQRLAQLHHVNIVDIIDYGNEEGRYYIVSEFVDGPNLKELMGSNVGRPMPLQQALEIARQIGSALDYAHNQQPAIIHRDIKPSNILLNRQGNRVVLCDFGLARHVEDETLDVSQAWGQVLGTPAYMSPEQCLDEPLDVRSDIYSFGVVLYEMFTGRHPFYGEHDTSSTLRRKHIKQPPPKPCKLNPTLKPQIEKVLLKALAKDPAERFQSVRELIEALERAYRAPNVSLLRSTPTFALAGIAVVVVAGVIWIRSGGLTNDHPSPTFTIMSSPTHRPILPTLTRTPEPTRPTHTPRWPTLTHTPEPTKPTQTPKTPTLTQPSPTCTPPQPTSMPISTGMIVPEQMEVSGAGESGYQLIRITGLSVAGGVLRLHGTVILPKDRYSDQVWMVEWAGDDVIGKLGLKVTDPRIVWWNVSGQHMKQDASNILVQWSPPQDVNCRVWVRLVAQAGSRSEKIYVLFDLRRLGVRCVPR